MHPLTKSRIPVVDGEAARRLAPSPCPPSLACPTDPGDALDLELDRLQRENDRLRAASRAPSKLDRFVGKSRKLARALDRLEALADLTTPILLVGEDGTGKTLAARVLHACSRRNERPFVRIRCEAMPGALLASTLLGDPGRGRAPSVGGRLREADGGTLFLDGIEALAPELQAILAQVATERRLFEPGASKARSAVALDVRLIAASRRPLAEAVAEGRFRPDLAATLSAASIEMPPLRERIEDVPLLVHHFLDRARAERGVQVGGLADAALERLMDHDWPGNVAELEDLIERLAVRVRTEEIAVHDLPEAIRAEPALRTWAPRVPSTGIDFNDVVERFENDLIAQALERTRWNKNQAARLLGLNRTTLVEKIKKRGLKPPSSLL